ncbi:hypothetical protein LDENG_00184420, partial [Lucifuga dentata]
KAVKPVLQPYFKIRHELSVKDDLVFRGARLVVPVSLRCTLIALAHEGHQGIVRSKQRLRELYWFPGIDALVHSQISACSLWQMTDKSAKVFEAPLQPVPLPDAPWRKLGLDIVGPFETATWHCKFAVTLTDYYSKWPEVAFTSSETTETVVEFLCSVFSCYGDPESLVTDNGPQFTSDAFFSFLKERGIAHIRSSVYHPAPNGAIERFNRVLKSCIQAAILQNKPWKSATTSFLQVYRAMLHAMTGLSPFELLHGRKMRTKLKVLPPPPVMAHNTEVRHRVALRQSHMKKYYDSRRGACTPSFKEGDRVRVRKPVHVPKGHPKFSAPIVIKKQVGPTTYILDDGKTWHASHLASVPNGLSKSPVQPKTGTEGTVKPGTAPGTGICPVRAHKPLLSLKDYET